MRIAISGSHSLGKSTVVNDWVAAHPEFRREEEPYRVLALNGLYEIWFRESSTRLHNGIQLYLELVGSRNQRLDQLRQAIAEVKASRPPLA